ncbi:hypothetical protein [Emticicia soli]|uniref:DUF4369 domain-containing protein n=1 Tax=Emticicia soli TaxID=2027878 RepID=A0ABW5J490_9BACT
MKKYITLFFVILIHAGSSAQNLNYILRSRAQLPTVERIDGKKVTTVEGKKITGSSNRNESPRLFTFLGSPFFIDNFQMGTFSIDSNTRSIRAPLLVNLTTDELMVKLSEKTTILQKVNFTIRGHNFITHNGRFYEQLYNGRVKLLKRYIRDVIPLSADNRNIASGFEGSQFYDGEIIDKASYYLVFRSNSMKEIKLTKKSIINILKKENKSLLARSDFKSLKENDSLIKAIETITILDEKSLIKALINAENTIMP